MTSLMKFEQGATIGGPGLALIVAEGVPVDVLNVDNTGVGSFLTEIIGSPPDSLTYPLDPSVDVPIVVNSGNGSPSGQVTPEVGIYGCLRLRLTTWPLSGQSGVPDVDIRNICVVTPNLKLVLPPYQKFPDPIPLSGTGSKPDEMNFEAQGFGWAGINYDAGTHPFRLVNEALKAVDALAGGGGGGRVLATYSGAGPHTLTPPGAGNTAVALVDTSGGPVTVNLPAALVSDEAFEVIDASGDAGLNPITVSGNGNTLLGSPTIVGNFAKKSYIAEDTFLGGAYFLG